MPFAAAANVEVEEKEDEGGEEEDDKEMAGIRKKGGCPTGSTIEHSRAQDLLCKQAIN